MIWCVAQVGLVFEMLQLMWYGFGTQMWMMWAAGLLAAMSSITYPAISAYVSIYADVDQQGEGHAYKENIFSSNILK